MEIELKQLKKLKKMLKHLLNQVNVLVARKVEKPASGKQ